MQCKPRLLLSIAGQNQFYLLFMRGLILLPRNPVARKAQIQRGITREPRRLSGGVF